MKTRLLAFFLVVSTGVAQEAPRDGTSAPALAGRETTLELKPEDYAVFTRAFELEKSYDWARARAVYDEVLLRQPDHAHAQAGKARVSEVIVANLQLEKCIAEAERLRALGSFQAAIRVFNRGMSVKPDYLGSDRFQALRATLMVQNTPVEVTFKSDGQTAVLIEHYRAPKKLEGETIKMLPGNYRVIGRRSGYQDIEQTLLVRVGAPQVVTVTCTVQSSTTVPPGDRNEQMQFQGEYQRDLNIQRLEEIRTKARFEEELESIRRSYFPVAPVIKAEV
jgi:hypothetical protein